MSATTTPVEYRVVVVPERHELEVTMTVAGPAANGTVELRTPTWVPGDYSFAGFGRDVFGLRASAADGSELIVRRDGWQGYRVEGATGRLRIEYTAYCSSWDFSEACGILGDRWGVLTGARYLCVPAADGPVVVAYELPDGWDIHHPSGARELGPSKWEYPSYELLLDTPVALGAFETVTRDVDGTPFHHVFLDRAVGFEAGVESFVAEVDAVASSYRQMFGSFPFESYTFVIAFNPNAEWGLEHLTSTMVGLGPAVFTDDDQHATAVRICAHELFHAWNVRRLRPAPLARLDLFGGSFTEGLWVAEGFTRYYEFLSCTRTGIYSVEQFISTVVNYYRHLAVLPAYGRVSAVDSSLASFLNHDDRFPGRVNDTIDYYDQGMVIAFGADALVRSEQAGDSLDRAFATFYDAFVGRGSGYTPEDLRDHLERVHPGAGLQVYAEATRPGELALVDGLRRLGFAVEEAAIPFVGLVLVGGAGPGIADVLDTSPAGRTGVAPEDVVTGVEGRPFDLPTLSWAISRQEAVTIDVLRGNEPRRFELPVARRAEISRVAWVGSEEQAGRIAAWLGHDFAPAPGQNMPLDFYENLHGIQTVI